MPHRFALNRLRARLARSEQRFSLLVTTVSDALYCMSPDWRQMLALNSAGFLQETPQADPDWLTRYIPPSDQPQVWAAIQAAIAGATAFGLEHRVLRADGTTGWMRSNAVPLRDSAGQITEWFGAAADISARKEAEEAAALRQLLAQQRLSFEAVQTAQEEERRRMAESLHNGIGQVLYAAKLRLQHAPADQHAQRDAAFLLSEAISQTRQLSHELTPTLLEQLGLQKTLETLCRQLAGRQVQWQCHIAVEGQAPLAKPLQIAVYRLAQGLAHNVNQHAQARHATLEVEVLPSWVVLRLEDDGRGFDPATVVEGLGLKTLRHRVALLSGTLRLDSILGQGTHIQVRLPLQAAP